MKAVHRRCILLIISSFQDQRPQQERARHQHWKDRLVSLLLMKMIVLSVCDLLSVSFVAVCVSAC